VLIIGLEDLSFECVTKMPLEELEVLIEKLNVLRDLKEYLYF
jgi:hypothetical protein